MNIINRYLICYVKKVLMPKNKIFDHIMCMARTYINLKLRNWSNFGLICSSYHRISHTNQVSKKIIHLPYETLLKSDDLVVL